MAAPDDTGLTPEGTLPMWSESEPKDGNADRITQTPRPPDTSENGAATVALPVLPLEAHRKDQERRRKARRDLEKALEGYFATLTRFREVEITKVAEILGSYASEIYDSSAAGYLVIPSLDLEALFGIAGPLNGGMAIADVEKQVSTLRVRRPWKISKDPAVRPLDDGRESMGLYFDDPWLRHEIREIVAMRVDSTRNAYAESNRTIANQAGTSLPNSSKVYIDSPPAVSARPLTRLMKEYEERLPLLTTRALERLQSRGAERERLLSLMIESAALKSREQTESVTSIEAMRAQKTAWTEDATEARLAEIVQMAADAARATVLDFAEGLHLSQQRLAVHTDLLRDYTARLIREVRSRVAKSGTFTSELSLPWQDDPIAQNAIRACEEKIDERSLIEGEEVPGRLNHTLAPKAWSPIVLQWEARKVPPQKPLAGPERIPESDLLALIAEQICCNPEDVTEVQIEGAALELCSHNGSFQIAPGESNDHALADYRALCETARPDSAFWKGREDEFRQHNTGENALLCAWLLSDDRWTFYIGGRMAPPSAEVSRSFKSLAREAAKGLRNRGGRQSWIDWLELLSCAEDEDTGKRHYNVMEGSSYSPENAIALPATRLRLPGTRSSSTD